MDAVARQCQTELRNLSGKELKLSLILLLIVSKPYFPIHLQFIREACVNIYKNLPL